MSSIELRGVSKRYRDTVALQPVDLTINEGEFFCLLGPSGCGKTTTLNLIGGFVEVSSGEIIIEGHRADAIPPYKRNVNTVFQNYALFPHLNVRDNVGFGLKMAKTSRKDAAPRIADALTLVGLEDQADRFPAQLSGGQQQRVAVARALVNRPAVLLLDEPLGALDLKLRKRLQVELSQIHKEVGTTFVFVTHDQEEAMAMADRIAVMNEGRIEQVGTPEEIYRRPASRFVADFIGESNFLEVERSGDNEVLAKDGSRVACSPPDGDWRRATLMVRPEDVQVMAGNGHREGLSGTVVRSSFLGSFTRVAVQCDSADAQIMAALQGGAASQLEENATATVTWAPQDAVVLDPQWGGTSMKQVLTRRDAVRAGALGVAGLYVAGCGSSSSSSQGSSSGPVTLNWVTWNDHYLPAQLQAVAKQTQITARPTLESDDSDGYLKVKQTGGQFDIVSTDALWAPKFHTDGLTEAFDVNSIPASSQLYPIARTFPFWTTSGGYLAYPNGWSTVQLYYNPAHVSPAPTSWHVLTEKKYAGKVVAESQPTDLMAMAGLATGAKEPYNMNTAEISKAQDFLKAAKPAFLKLVSQNSDSVRALADGSAWIAIENLGTDFRVKAAGGPTVKIATPTEGVFGFIDGEQIVKASAHKNRFNQFMNAMAQPNWIAQNFLANGRPLFNEKAYKYLVDHGYKDRADLLFYNQPERALKMTLKGPSGNVQAYIDAFNSVFGA